MTGHAPIRESSQGLRKAYLSAMAFSSAGSRLHHKICHVLGGAYDLPHAVVLPYLLAFNPSAAPQAERRIAEALGAASALGVCTDCAGFQHLDGLSALPGRCTAGM
ncbi:hypothetical protein ACRJ4B_12090 [Streptomyces sp. GTA36]